MLQEAKELALKEISNIYKNLSENLLKKLQECIENDNNIVLFSKENGVDFLLIDRIKEEYLQLVNFFVISNKELYYCDDKIFRKEVLKTKKESDLISLISKYNSKLQYLPLTKAIIDRDKVEIIKQIADIKNLFETSIAVKEQFSQFLEIKKGNLFLDILKDDCFYLSLKEGKRMEESKYYLDDKRIYEKTFLQNYFRIEIDTEKATKNINKYCEFYENIIFKNEKLSNFLKNILIKKLKSYSNVLIAEKKKNVKNKFIKNSSFFYKENVNKMLLHLKRPNNNFVIYYDNIFYEIFGWQDKKTINLDLDEFGKLKKNILNDKTVIAYSDKYNLQKLLSLGISSILPISVDKNKQYLGSLINLITNPIDEILYSDMNFCDSDKVSLGYNIKDLNKSLLENYICKKGLSFNEFSQMTLEALSKNEQFILNCLDFCDAYKNQDEIWKVLHDNKSYECFKESTKEYSELKKMGLIVEKPDLISLKKYEININENLQENKYYYGIVSDVTSKSILVDVAFGHNLSCDTEKLKINNKKIYDSIYVGCKVKVQYTKYIEKNQTYYCKIIEIV